MPKLKLENGATYGYGANGEKICTGSQMGRRDWLPVDKLLPVKLYLTPLRWVDYDYDQGGAYWGGSGGTIYCAWTVAEFPCQANAYSDIPQQESVRVFVRAQDRERAKELVRESLPNATFYR